MVVFFVMSLLSTAIIILYSTAMTYVLRIEILLCIAAEGMGLFQIILGIIAIPIFRSRKNWK